MMEPARVASARSKARESFTDWNHDDGLSVDSVALDRYVALERAEMRYQKAIGFDVEPAIAKLERLMLEVEAG